MVNFLKTIQKTVSLWYLPVIIGIALMLVGFYIFTIPAATYATLTVLFSLSFLFSGILEVIFSLQNQKSIDSWAWYLIGGLFNAVVGVILLVHPGISAEMLPFFVGFIFLFRSIQGLGFAFEYKNYGSKSWGGLAFLSVLGFLFSLLLIFNPIIGAAYLVALTSLAFIFSGIVGISIGFQLKKLKHISSKVKDNIKEKIDQLKEEYYDHIKD